MRTVLFLINGFGIEKKESFSLYNSSIMPNFDMLMNRYMFSSLKSDVHNIYDGYRNMSLEISELYNYHLFQREINNGNFVNNEKCQKIKAEFDNRGSKLHLFCFVDT